MKNLTKILLSIYVAIMMFAVACKKDEPTPTTPVTPTTTPPVLTKSSAKDITKFSFAALSPVVDATIDATTKAITTTVPTTTDLTKLIPTITISDKASISPATGVAQDFSKEVIYTVTAEDGSTVVYKVNVTKQAVSTVTITQRQKLPVIADMGSVKVLFTINSKIYYLGNSKASTRDFKYFFEYDPSADKWTQKADFPFKSNLDGNGFPLTSDFIHNGKAYFSSSYYGFMEYDPTTDKWVSLNYAVSRFDDYPLYFQGLLFIFGSAGAATYEFDSKKSKSYSMTGADFFSGVVVRRSFMVDNKIYIQTYTDETATTKQRFDTYEADYANGKYIKKASFEGEQKYNTMGSTFSGTTKGNSLSLGYLVDGKIYNFSTNNILTYNPKNDTYQAIKSPQNFSSYSLYFGGTAGSFVVIGKTLYVLDYNNAIISAQML